MSQVARVLKRDTFRQAEPRAVQDGAAVAVGGPASHAVQARIIEHGERLAVIEVLCQCGHKITLHCVTTPSAANRTVNGD